MVERGEIGAFFRWFGPDTREKDVNERVVALGDPAVFSDQAALEKMMYTPLQTKMWMA